jgi:hypothetical protein
MESKVEHGEGGIMMTSQRARSANGVKLPGFMTGGWDTIAPDILGLSGCRRTTS